MDKLGRSNQSLVSQIQESTVKASQLQREKDKDLISINKRNEEIVQLKGQIKECQSRADESQRDWEQSLKDQGYR